MAARYEMRWGYPAAVEAKAALLTIQLCHEMGFLNVHLEGDAKTVVAAVNSGDVSRSWLGGICLKISNGNSATWLVGR
jgi:hypothetical protein